MSISLGPHFVSAQAAVAGEHLEQLGRNLADYAAVITGLRLSIGAEHAVPARDALRIEVRARWLEPSLGSES